MVVARSRIIVRGIRERHPDTTLGRLGTPMDLATDTAVLVRYPCSKEEEQGDRSA